jgi:phosphoglycolate phosphatase-like HAD superfamily hydrolase
MVSGINVQQLVKDKKVIFWDFDGVIKESVDIKTNAFVSLFRSFGIEVSEKVRAHHIKNGGMSRFQKFPIYMQWSGLEPSLKLVEFYSQKFKELVYKEVISCDWVEGAEEFIRLNKYQQIFVMVSATPQVELEMIVTELKLKDLFFDICGSPKSKKSSIEETLKKLEIDKQDAIMIGDATADLDAAQFNGISFLLRRNQSNQSIFSQYIGWSINDFTEI